MDSKENAGAPKDELDTKPPEESTPDAKPPEEEEVVSEQDNRVIRGSIISHGRVFKRGDEDALAKVLPQSDMDRLVGEAVITGDWKSQVSAVALKKRRGGRDA